MEVGIWPPTQVVDPDRWLRNFEKKDRKYAAYLLNSFLFYCEGFVDQMYLSAFQGLSRGRHIRSQGDAFAAVQIRWNSFLNEVVVTQVTKERPNPTESGHIFARKARQVLGIDKARIVDSKEALRRFSEEGAPVVFVDDFVGSGEQFIATWRRKHLMSDGSRRSFATTPSSARGGCFYCPLICTRKGYDNIRSQCAEVGLSPAHVLPDEYSVLSPASIVWPPDIRAKAVAWLKQVSCNLGIPDCDGDCINDWQGYRKLGLSLAFQHGVPDATLPIFYWEQNGWEPLHRRT